MKIIEVAAYYPPHIGGVEFVAKNLAETFVVQGNQVTVLTSTVGANSKGTSQEKGVCVKRLRGFEFAHTPVMPLLFWELLRTPYDAVIHLHLSHVFTELTVFLVCRIKRLPYVAHFHMDVDVSGRLGWIFRLYKRFILRYVLRAAARVIALSDEQAALVCDRYGVASEKVVVLPNGVSDDFYIDKARTKVHAPIRLLFVGRFAKQKNLQRMLSVFAELKVKAELHLVGDGEQRSEIEMFVKKKAISGVYFDGVLSGEKLARAYAEADIFLMTSDREGMPLALLEAAASGLPIVASDVQGLREFVAKNGILVDPLQPQLFARAIEKLAADDVYYKKMSAASFSWASDYRWSSIAIKVTEVLDAVRAK